MQPSDDTYKELPSEVLVLIVHLLQESSDAEGEEEIHYVHSYECQWPPISLHLCLLLTNTTNPNPLVLPSYSLPLTDTQSLSHYPPRRKTVYLVRRHLQDGIRKISGD